MSTATIEGTVVYPISPSGPDVSLLIGAPSITSSSTTGATLTFTEMAVNTYLVKQADAVVTIPFGTLVGANILYVGSDQPIDVKINASLTAFALAVGGFIFVYKGTCTSMTVQATTTNDATVQVALLGS